MSADDLCKEAERIMVICNACRYCEGFCAVFPAMELRRTFSPQDLKYLANLCHNCRGCYYACQYAPPHFFEVNVPKALGRLRLETYRESASPEFLGGLIEKTRQTIPRATAFGIVVWLLVALVCGGFSGLFSDHAGSDAFYRVIPLEWMLWLFGLSGLAAAAALGAGCVRFWHGLGNRWSELLNPRANLRALGDALRLRYLGGGGFGCNYPDERFSMVRRWLHHLVFYGFMLCFAATTIAAVYDHFLGWPAPYPLWSWPVVLGALGGIALVLGTGGLLVLKRRMDREPAVARFFSIDVGFLLQLGLTALSGLLLLMLRETRAMGILLVVHLGLVLGLFLTFACGKLVHAVYRYAALVQYALERMREEEA